MTPEERQVITGIFERLQAAESHPRDPEAEQLIAQLMARQPYATYALAQSFYVHEQALASLNQRNVELERQLQEAHAVPAQNQPQSGGFLSSLFGGARPEPASPGSPQGGSLGVAPAGPPSGGGGPAAYPPSQQGYPPSQQGYPPSQPGYPPGGPWGAQPRGGGFLHGAMTTAAGVAGGMVLANALSSAFSHGAGGLGSAFGGLGSAGLGTPAAAGTLGGGAAGSGLGALGLGGAGQQAGSVANIGNTSDASGQDMLRDAARGSPGGASDSSLGPQQSADAGSGLDDDRGVDQAWSQASDDDASFDDDTSSDDGSLDDDSGFTTDV